MDDLLGDVTLEEVDQQQIGWDRSAWQQCWTTKGLPRLDAVDEVADEYEQHGTIRRSFIYGQREDCLGLFIAAMAWGFGNRAYGPSRVAKMLTTCRGSSSPERAIGEIVKKVQEAGAKDGFSALFDTRGRTKVFNLGVAFGTKLLHFAAYEGDSPGPRPLILDVNVWKARSVAGAPHVPNPRQYVSAVAYLRYCEEAADLAPEPLGPVAVEYALFHHGREL